MQICSQGPVVQSIVSLMSSLVVKMFNCSSNCDIYFIGIFAEKATNIFSAKILVHMPYLMIKVHMPYLMIKVLTIC